MAAQLWQREEERARAPDKYIDLGYYERALKLAGARM